MSYCFKMYPAIFMAIVKGPGIFEVYRKGIYPVILYAHRKGIFLYIPAIFERHRNRDIFGQHAGTGRPRVPPKGHPLYHDMSSMSSSATCCLTLPICPIWRFVVNVLTGISGHRSVSQSCRALSMMASANSRALVRCPHEQTTM